ncbi:hypothetical protein Sjap_011606 [Stephania japonica]|uniref:Uncharacterized protein n=1 Tax=Stephania japonica TaxID=461633 RepID=A0AAP0JBX4_9MAGN
MIVFEISLVCRCFELFRVASIKNFEPSLSSLLQWLVNMHNKWFLSADIFVLELMNDVKIGVSTNVLCCHCKAIIIVSSCVYCMKLFLCLGYVVLHLNCSISLSSFMLASKICKLQLKEFMSLTNH